MSRARLLSIADGGPGLPPPPNFWTWFSSCAVNRASSLALTAYHQLPGHLSNLFPVSTSPSTPSSGPGCFRCTFAQLLDAVEKLATILYDKGLREGDVVAAFIGNDRGVEWALLLWTSWRIGAVFAPVEPNLLARKAELREVRRLLNPKVAVLTDGADVKSWTETSAGQEGQLIQVVCSGDIDPGRDGEWSSLSRVSCPSNRESSSPPPAPASLPTQPALIMFTSGTTSTPKGCRLTFANIHAEITGYHAFAHSRWSSDTKFLATSSVFRPICYLGSLNAWTAGGSVIFAASTFDPATTIAVLAQERATHLMMLPTQLRAVTNILAQQPSTLQHELLFVTVAGDVSDWELLSSARQALKARRLVPHWGMSEGAPLFAFASVDHASAPPPVLENGVPSVGYALPGTKAKICPAKGSPSTTPVPRGVQGELHVASLALIHNYLDSVSRASFYEDAQGRWFRTGDLAVMDQEGMVYVVGRIKDTIKCRGIGIYPPVMERCLMDLFGVEAVVIGVPDVDDGEKPVAVLMSLPATVQDNKDGIHAETTKQAIIRGVPAHLGPDYILGGVYTLEEVGLADWPLNSSAKLDKRALRGLVQRTM
ncbi:hypothetical protein BDW68DRAFT_195133 [Aspergillus falconensis]